MLGVSLSVSVQMETPHLAVNKGRACVRLIEAADVLLATGDLSTQEASPAENG